MATVLFTFSSHKLQKYYPFAILPTLASNDYTAGLDNKYVISKASPEYFRGSFFIDIYPLWVYNPNCEDTPVGYGVCSVKGDLKNGRERKDAGMLQA
ncbi:MAG: hypothetical protein K6B75_00690 [Lachnospiraceae bacterium]|nr:hypothetical protein [Lachnospiraceae bacterium]